MWLTSPMLTELTVERARALFDYDPLTGVVTRKIATSNAVMVGDIVGSETSDGYLRVWINGHSYKLHRVIWLLHSGRWPRGQLDHRSGKRSDNRIANLREADQSQQSANTARPRNNTTGVKGVSIHKATGKYTARLACRGRLVHASYHDNIEAAAEAYRQASLQHFGEFSSINREISDGFLTGSNRGAGAETTNRWRRS